MLTFSTSRSHRWHQICSQSLSLTDSHGARTIAITINVDGTGHDLQVSNIAADSFLHSRSSAVASEQVAQATSPGTARVHLMASREEIPSQTSSVQAVPSFKFVPHTEREQIYREFSELDAQEQAIVRKRAELNQLLNTFLPIHKLPNELLIHIFSDFHDDRDIHTDDIIRSGMYQRSPIRKDWLRLMLVCRHWRDVLISAPTFWRYIDLKRYHVKWTNLCLGRSNPALLHVMAGSRANAHLDILHPHVHRFQKFFLIVANGTDMQTVLPPLFGSGMPLLEGLRFAGTGPGDNNLDVHLTSERFPSLRTLLLTRTMAPPDISLYAQLRMLELKLCHHTFSFEGFLDALAASVQLEELSIYETLSSLSSEDPTWAHGGPDFCGPPAVLLPALRQFTLIGNSIARTSRFLAHLQFQPCAVLDICADVPRPGPGPGVASPNTALSFSAMLPPNPSATLPSLAFATAVCMRIEGGNCELRYDPPSPIVDSPDCPSESPYMALFLELHHSQWGPFMATGLGDVVRTFGRSPLTCLVVEGNHTYGTAAAWERIFRTFPLLEELNVGGHPPSDVAVVFRGLHAASTSTSVSMMDGTPWARSPVRTSSAFMLQE
ncbi:hypothetical protein V8D89_000731 [Ganoderma adspersum]